MILIARFLVRNAKKARLATDMRGGELRLCRTIGEGKWFRSSCCDLDFRLRLRRRPAKENPPILIVNIIVVEIRRKRKSTGWGQALLNPLPFRTNARLCGTFQGVERSPINRWLGQTLQERVVRFFHPVLEFCFQLGHFILVGRIVYKVKLL